MRLCSALAILLAAWGFFAGSANAAGTAQPVLPPYTAAYQPQGTDERGIWMDADEDERLLRDSPFLIRDEALRDYVARILCRTVGDDRCRGVRVYVLRVAAFNASMAPNGAMRVWSGLLLRVRSEAELAAILGHEFAHFELRHSLVGFRQQRVMSDIATWALFLGQTGQTIRSSALGAIYSFGRDQERQADLLSLKYMLKSDYSAKAAAHVWNRIMDEADATALGRKQRSRRYDRVAFFATHPTDLERATVLSELAKDAPERGEAELEYRAAMARWTPLFLEDQLRLNDFGGTEYLLGQLAGAEWQPSLLHARGELYRLRGHPRDLVAAADFYRAALDKEAGMAPAWRGMGLALMRGGRQAEGRDALQRYLTLSPTATDAPMIKMLTAQ